METSCVNSELDAGDGFEEDEHAVSSTTELASKIVRFIASSFGTRRGRRNRADLAPLPTLHAAFWRALQECRRVERK